MSYSFNEKSEEYSSKLNKNIPVWQSPKYKEAKEKAIDIIKNGKLGLSESDFWILMNQTKTEKMAYTSLIISHNGCLKINDGLSDKFNPLCVSFDKDGYSGSLVYTYCNVEQGIYEVGEVNKSNCSNNYPYAMALKRCFDRVILKLSKLAYSGIMSDSESDEFSQKFDITSNDAQKTEYISEADRKALFAIAKKKYGNEYSVKLKGILGCYEISGTKTMTYDDYNIVLADLAQ